MSRSSWAGVGVEDDEAALLDIADYDEGKK